MSAAQNRLHGFPFPHVATPRFFASRLWCMHASCLLHSPRRSASERRSTHLERFNKGIFTGPHVKVYATFQKKCTSGMIWYQVCFYRRCLVEGAGLS